MILTHEFEKELMLTLKPRWYRFITREYLLGKNKERTMYCHIETQLAYEWFLRGVNYERSKTCGRSV